MYIYIYEHMYICIMLEFNMLAFVLYCNWLLAHGSPVFVCKMYLNGSWTSRSAGISEGRQICLLIANCLLSLPTAYFPTC